MAMHGWAGDSRCWAPWISATAELGWRWTCGERGYGSLQPQALEWPEPPSGTLRLVIGHSLGPHLLSPEVWIPANAVVLLASFGTFVPPDRAGRKVRMALDGMAAKLSQETEARDMLKKFLGNSAYPEQPGLLPSGPESGPLHLTRLGDDLQLLGSCRGLPRGFPAGARVLIIEAGSDRIVDPTARAMLREALPEADVIQLPEAGHAILGTGVISQVAQWVESMR